MTAQPIVLPDRARTASALSSARSRRPFVALYTDSAEPSGLGAHMLTLADALADRCDFAFVCHDAPQALALIERAFRGGHEANVLPPGDRAWPTLRSWLQARRPDLFHVHAGVGWEGLAGPGLARRAGVSAVIRTEHLPDVLTDPDQRTDYAAMLADLDARICVSEAAARSFGSATDITVVRNGVVPVRGPRRTRAETRAALHIGPDQPVVLTVARFTPQKGHDLLLRAAEHVHAARPDAVFLWAGEGPTRPALQAEAGARGLEGVVRFLGDRGDAPELMAAADLFVLPSRFEGLPLALLEALHAALPTVATRVPGTAEIFDTDEAAELVPPEDADALAAAVLRVLNDPDLADELADRGRRLARRRFSARRMGDETFALYRRLLAHAQPRVAATLQ